MVKGVLRRRWEKVDCSAQKVRGVVEDEVVVVVVAVAVVGTAGFAVRERRGGESRGELVVSNDEDGGRLLLDVFAKAVVRAKGSLAALLAPSLGRAMLHGAVRSGKASLAEKWRMLSRGCTAGLFVAAAKGTGTGTADPEFALIFFGENTASFSPTTSPSPILFSTSSGNTSTPLPLALFTPPLPTISFAFVSAGTT